MLTIEDRTKAKASYPKTVLEEKHLAGARILPDRQDLLNRMRKNAVVAEIGVAYGDFTTDILTRTQPKRLHLIDMWEGERYGPGGKNVADKFGAEIEAGTIVISQGRSVDVLKSHAGRLF